ncbi:MAG: AMP-binding enzyme [Burkholderiaceae bacterium]
MKLCSFNIYPNEIEDVLKQLVDTDECAVFGVPNEQLGECVACAWVSHSSISKEELIEHCKKYLSIYKIPQRWMNVNTMPRNSSGKIIKNQLLQMLLK